MALQPVVDQSRIAPFLGEKDVVVKFNFTNREHIPAGIEEKVRLTNEIVDHVNSKRAEESGNKRLGRVGRFRQGRVDTGFPVVQNLPMTQAAMIRTGLANNGYRLRDAHWYATPFQAGKTTKYVVVLSFQHGIEENLELNRKTYEAVRKLAKTVWYCHVWQNTLNFTVNFVGIQVGAKPKHSITTKNGQLAAVPVSDFTEESGE